jgi:cyanate permease
MEHLYKGHLIQVSVWEDSTGWVVNLYISYQEGVQSVLITFMLNQTWATYSEAVEAGLAIAKRWIDDGKS